MWLDNTVDDTLFHSAMLCSAVAGRSKKNLPQICHKQVTKAVKVDALKIGTIRIKIGGVVQVVRAWDS